MSEKRLKEAAENAYNAWMGGTMNDVREAMKELGEVLEKIEQKPTLSEEDEERFQSCVNILQEKGFMGVGVIETINSKWLKSIKDRISQPHWKPSDEQMKALLDILHPDEPNFYELKLLYQDLQKL